MAQNPITSRGGRPRKVSPQDALDLAEQVFWQRGLEGSTLDDLSRATGLKRPSIAATFGNKRALYLTALRQRVARNTAGFAELLAAPGPLVDVLTATFEAALRQHLEGDDGARGCFVMSTAVAPARHDADVAAILRQSLQDTERLLRERFERESIADAPIRGAMAAAAIHNLAIRARAGEDEAALQDHARSAATWLASTANATAPSAAR